MSEGAHTIRCEARGSRFDVRCDRALAETTASILAGLHAPDDRSADPPAATFTLSNDLDADGLWRVRSGSQVLMACEQPSDALHGLMVHITQWVVASRSDLLSVHAAAVSIGRAGVLLPGSSGSGKTTLCARLVQRGAAYLSDDSIGLERDGSILPYAKPLGFKWGSRGEFPDLDLTGLDLDGGRQLVWQVPPSRLGETAMGRTDVAVVAIPRFEPGAELDISPIPAQAAARELLAQSQNLGMVGVRGALERIGALVGRCPAFSVSYGDARDAAPVLEHLAAAGPRGAVREHSVIETGEGGGDASEPLPADGVTVLRFDEGALLVSAGAATVAAVDATGARVWPLIDGTRTPAAIARELAEEFDVPVSQIEVDISLWIDQLLDHGFLRRPAGGVGA